MDAVTLAAATAAAKKSGDSRYLRTAVGIGSPLVRAMLDAAALASPPTLTAQTAQFSGYTTFVSPSSTIFRISGAPLINSSGYFPRNAHKTDSSVSFWGGCLAVEFDLESSDLVFKSQVPTGAAFKLWVNEQPHSLTPTTMSTVTGVSGSGSNYFKAAFGTRAYRRIRLELVATTSAPAAFGGIYLSATDAMFPPSIPSPKFLVIGDSYAYGVSTSGQVWTGDAYAILLARALGFANVINFTGVPSTGVIATNPGNLYGNYASRFAFDVVPLAPDVIVYQGSVNDGPYVGLSQIGPQFASDIASLRASLPNAKIIGTSALYVGAASAAQLGVTSEMSAAATAAGVPFVDVMTPGYFTGTGSVGATNGSGNSDFYATNNGGLHPTLNGATALAKALAQKIAPILGQAR